MSYILDAIKKSEADRGNGSIPSVQTMHSSSLKYKTDSRLIWPYILIALLTLNLVGLGLYFFYDRSDTTHTAQLNEQTALSNTKNSAPAVSTQAITEPRIAISEPIRNQKTINPPPTYTEKPTQSYKTTYVEDLPDNIKQRIPAMQFNGHVYSSTPYQRSIFLNGIFLEEGDQFSDEISLTEITLKGAIFSYHDTYFEVTMLEGWAGT